MDADMVLFSDGNDERGKLNEYITYVFHWHEKQKNHIYFDKNRCTYDAVFTKRVDFQAVLKHLERSHNLVIFHDATVNCQKENKELWSNRPHIYVIAKHAAYKQKYIDEIKEAVKKKQGYDLCAFDIYSVSVYVAYLKRTEHEFIGASYWLLRDMYWCDDSASFPVGKKRAKVKETKTTTTMMLTKNLSA